MEDNYLQRWHIIFRFVTVLYRGNFAHLRRDGGGDTGGAFVEIHSARTQRTVPIVNRPLRELHPNCFRRYSLRLR